MRITKQLKAQATNFKFTPQFTKDVTDNIMQPTTVQVDLSSYDHDEDNHVNIVSENINQQPVNNPH